jgi:hypothetical protein
MAGADNTLLIEDADSGVYTEKESGVEPTGMASDGPVLSSWREDKQNRNLSRIRNGELLLSPEWKLILGPE